MTVKQRSMLNYILGRLEGISCGCADTIRGAILDTCEMLSMIIDEADRMEEEKLNEMPTVKIAEF